MKKRPEKIDWKFQENAEPQGGSDGFWYDITEGGYIKPEFLLANSAQLDMVRNAVAVLESFESALEDAGLLNEF